jgi:hypothetical protein
MADQHRTKSRDALFISIALLVLCIGVLISYQGYLWGLATPNPGELLGSLLFWPAVVGLLLMFPLHDAFKDFMRSVRSALGAVVFTGYLAVHLVLYGFLLEALLTFSYGSSLLAVSSAGLFVTTDVFSPPSLESALLDLAYNPSIILTDPPVFSAALSFYAISVALVIGVLVLANVTRTRELGRLCSASKRARSLVLIPALGVVLGASCCLSVAGLVSLYTVPLALATELATSLLVYYITYFFLPAFAVVILYLNLRSIGRLSEVLSSSAPSPPDDRQVRP